MPTPVIEDASSALLASEQQRAIRTARVAAVLGIIAFVGFAAVDPLVTQKNLDILLLARAIIVSALLAVIGLSFCSIPTRVALALPWANHVLIGVGVVVVTVLVGGGTSNYHFALVVDIFGYAALQPSTMGLFGSFATVLTILYAWAMWAFDVTGPLPLFLTNIAILLLSALVASTGLVINNRLRASQFVLDFTLRRAHERLTEIDQAKNQFFANISHELRTPLTLIIASTESLREAMQSRGEPVPQDLVACRRNGIRLLREVDELLELSRLESATMRRRVRGFDLKQMLIELAAQIAPLAERKQIVVATDINPDVTAMPIDADDTQIERVWLNLAANAVKFTPDGGKITLGLRMVDAQTYEGWVEDTGEGIPPAALDKIFDRFFQAPNALAGRRSGAGLGLSLVRRIVEVHGGVVSATSVLGQGTRISFTLPRGVVAVAEGQRERRSEQVLASNERRRGQGLAEWDGVLRSQDEYRLWNISAATEPLKEPKPTREGDGPLVLVADDNPDVLELLTGVLGGTYRLATATDGEEALAQARRLHPDLVLSDVMMPNMNGLQLLAALRADTDLRTVPVVLLTARGQEEDRIAAGEGGADAYLAKPFHPQELRTILRNILRKQEAQAAAVIDERALALRVMAEGVAHDVLNPLGFVRGALLILSRLNAEAVEIIGPDNSRAAEIARDSDEFYRSGDEGLQRAIAAVGELRRFTRGDTKSEVARIDVNDAVRRVITVAATQGKVASLLGARQPVLLRPGQLEQVLLNLIINAQQAAGAEAEVRVTTWDDETTHVVALAVRDNGPGMDRGTLQRVFDPYFTTKEMGTGLGLTVSRQIIRDGGGTLTVESQTGKGTTFTIRLPPAALPVEDEKSAAERGRTPIS